VGSRCGHVPGDATKADVKRRSLCNEDGIFGEYCPPDPVTRTGPPGYVLYMFSTLLVLGGVLIGLILLLVLIVRLSVRPQTAAKRAAGRVPSWVADAGRSHPDAWAPLSTTTTNELPAIR
jgi:hypothetical protein